MSIDRENCRLVLELHQEGYYWITTSRPFASAIAVSTATKRALTGYTTVIWTVIACLEVSNKETFLSTQEKSTEFHPLSYILYFYLYIRLLTEEYSDIHCGEILSLSATNNHFLCSSQT